MNSARQSDRLESSLLDRLTDRGGDKNVGERAVSRHRVADRSDAHPRRGHAKRVNQVREEIERDLLYLLTTRNIEQSVDLSAWPAVRSSVLNFGLPDLTGATSSGVDLADVSRKIKKLVETFEPRFHAGSVQCCCRLGDTPNEIRIEIDGLFGPEDDLQTFAISSVICLSSGQIVRKLAA